jgi:DHA1 family tetracycline resistance protein-like MFS transporter
MLAKDASPAEARAFATVVVGGVRGFLLDLCTSRDRQRFDRAVKTWLQSLDRFRTTMLRCRRYRVTNKHHAAVSFIFVTVLLGMLAFGIALPVLPKLISEFVGGDMARASQYLALFMTTFALMQFFFSPVLGMLSDRYGRRPVVLLSNFGLALDYIIMAMAPSLRWFFLARILSGLCSSNFGTATAYISDITAPEKRSKAFGLLAAAYGVGFIVGPAIGGWLGLRNPRLPFWVAGAASLLNAAYGLFVLPESLTPERRQRRLAWKKANPIGALLLLRSHAELLGLASVSFLGYLAYEVYATVWILYVMYRFGWNQRMIGMALTVVGVLALVYSAALVGPLVARFGERRTLLAGLLFAAAGFVLYGLAGSSITFFAAVAITALWQLAGPTSQSLMTQRVSASEQGELQGAIASLRGIAMIVGPQMFSSTFVYFISRDHHLPGAPWYLAALLVAISLVIALYVTSDTKRPKEQAETSLAGAEAEAR